MENSSRPLWKENRFYFAKRQVSHLEESSRVWIIQKWALYKKEYKDYSNNYK
jgi:hypothetical protein